MSDELSLFVTARRRGGERLDELPPEEPPDPSIEELTRLLSPHCDSAPRIWLIGGEPTLRSDLPELIQVVKDSGHAVGLVTDALPLSRQGAAGPLETAGLDRVRVHLHAARADAHDWLVQRPGAARLAVRAVGRLTALGVGVELVARVTRSTLPLVTELVEAAALLGVERVHFHRPVGRGAVAADYIALAPRMASLGPYLEQALLAAERREVRVTFHGFPECVAPPSARALPGDTAVLVPDGAEWDAVRVALGGAAHERGCPRCPGLPRCAGAPSDYVARFGRTELRSEQQAGVGQHAEPLRSASIPLVPVPAPPPRHGRPPSTRLSAVRSVLGKPLDGDPLALLAAEPSPTALRMRFAAPSRVACAVCGDHADGAHVEPTRSVRARLVRAAQEGASVLRIASAGSLAHPEAAALLRETTLLSFARVELAGEASALDELSDADLYGLRGIARVDLALYGSDAPTHDEHVGRPGAFAKTLRAAPRVAEVTGAEVGAFAVLHDAREVEAFARAWQSGVLPGEPAFRLSTEGDSLEALALAARALGEGPAQDALSRVLPPCLLPRGVDVLPNDDGGSWFEDELDRGRAPSGSDRYGNFRKCGCGAEQAPRCPGLAVGWRNAVKA